MKSPKQLLLEQSADAGPALDAIRGEVIRPLRTAHSGWLPTRFLVEAWTQLVWEGRIAWGGLAVVWICLFAASSAPDQNVQSATQGMEQLRPVSAWQTHQRRLRAELNLPLDHGTTEDSTPSIRRQSRRALQVYLA